MLEAFIFASFFCLKVITSLHHFLTHSLILSCLNLIFIKGQNALFHHAHHFNSFHLFALQIMSLNFLQDIKAFYYLSSISFYLAAPAQNTEGKNFIWHSGPIVVICCHHSTEQAAINSMSAQNFLLCVPRFLHTSFPP